MLAELPPPGAPAAPATPTLTIRYRPPDCSISAPTWGQQRLHGGQQLARGQRSRGVQRDGAAHRRIDRVVGSQQGAEDLRRGIAYVGVREIQRDGAAFVDVRVRCALGGADGRVAAIAVECRPDRARRAEAAVEAGHSRRRGARRERQWPDHRLLRRTASRKRAEQRQQAGCEQERAPRGGRDGLAARRQSSWQACRRLGHRRQGHRQRHVAHLFAG